MAVRRRTWTVVCSASSDTGSSTPFSADFEMRVTLIAHVEWNRTVAATFNLDGGGGGARCSVCCTTDSGISLVKESK
jgi:hypothetical protein